MSELKTRSNRGGVWLPFVWEADTMLVLCVVLCVDVGRQGREGGGGADKQRQGREWMRSRRTRGGVMGKTSGGGKEQGANR